MIDDPTELSIEEEAYFDSRGEATPPEAVEAVVEKPEPVVEKEPEKPKLIPVEVLQEERRERQALARQIQEREQEFIRVQTRLEALQEALNPKAEPPRYDEDPIGALKHEIDQTSKGYRELQQAEQLRAQSAQAAAQIEQLRAFGKAQADAYTEKQPDFWDAYTAVQGIKEAELRAQGYTNDAQIRQWITEYEISVIDKAAREGANPAERLYAMAKAYGYAPKQAAQETAEKKLESIKAGQSASKSLSTAAGSSPPAKLTLDALKDMSDEEFERATSDMSAWRRLNTGN